MPNNIDAAFCSSKVNECYVFVKDKYMVVNYAPGSKKKDIISGPTKIVDGFPMFAGTLFQYQIDSSFDTGNNVAYFFSGDQCAKVEYTAHSLTKARLLLGPVPINAMFPTLKGTVFENGIDAIVRSYRTTFVFLFKGDQYLHLDFQSNTRGNKGVSKICNSFAPLLGTVFEGGIDAAFNTHVDSDHVFIFKGKYYTHYDIYNDTFLNGKNIIRLISDDWPALGGIL